jgi:hypothetical protein
MTSIAVEPGAIVWAVMAACIVVWLIVLLASTSLVGPRRVARWLLGSWPSRLVMVLAWGAIGWHIFCQRP